MPSPTTPSTNRFALLNTDPSQSTPQPPKQDRIFSKAQIEAYEARCAKRAAKAKASEKSLEEKDRQTTSKSGMAVYTAEQTREYEARKTRKAEGKAAYEMRQAKREERVLKEVGREDGRVRGEKAGESGDREDGEDGEQEEAKKAWIQECLRYQACFNCGDLDHYTNDCPEPPYEGKY